MEKEIAVLLSQLQGIAQSGLEYGKDVFDLERYQQLQTVTFDLLRQLTVLPADQLQFYLENDAGYATPKVDIRGIVFQADKLLLVQEKSDQSWALPGGWGDIGYSPFEVAEKEIFEEAGIKVKAKRLLAVRDKAKHPYPASLTYVYKFLIVCEATEMTIKTGIETSAVGFFSLPECRELPLSLGRNLLADLELAFLDHHTPQATYCD